MKTRNNQSHADETLLNQSITRRSFVKRGAVASAATVFGTGVLRAIAPPPPDIENPYVGRVSLGDSYTFQGGTLSATVADMAAARQKIIDWSQGKFAPGEMTGAVQGARTPWPMQSYKKRKKTPVKLQDPVIWAISEGDLSKLTLRPHPAGGFTLLVDCLGGQSLTVQIQHTELKAVDPLFNLGN